VARRHNFVAVVGESQHQETLRGLAVLFDTIGRSARNFDATLKPEPENPYDANAVAVTTADGTKVGYLPRDLAKQFHRAISAMPPPVVVRAELRGGDPDQGLIGVVLDFSPVFEPGAVKSGSTALRCPHCDNPMEQDSILCPTCNKDVRPPSRHRPAGRAQPAPVSPTGLNKPVPAEQLWPIVTVVVGTFVMLIGSLRVGGSGTLVFAGWLISLVGIFLLLKGHSVVVRCGGAFILSLVLMAISISMNR
jgi:hypothetical protein